MNPVGYISDHATITPMILHVKHYPILLPSTHHPRPLILGGVGAVPPDTSPTPIQTPRHYNHTPDLIKPFIRGRTPMCHQISLAQTGLE